MDDYKTAYAKLNPKQLEAVKRIQGPVLVIAGPGTGKTQLLALRAAQILKDDPTMLPGNILCLTFTDSAASNMRERLIKYIGQDAYQVAIHTFNSFGSYVMNIYPEYFYEWREVKTADELTAYRLLEQIMEELPGSHILAGRGQDGTFFSLTALRNLISDSKRANLTPDDLKKIFSQNQAAYTEIIPAVRKYWPERISKAALSDLHELVTALAEVDPADPPAEAIKPVKNLIITSLAAAAAQSAKSDSREATKPFSAWRAEWLEKDAEGLLVFKNSRHHERLMSAAEVYESYQQALESRGMADFSDQIAWVLRAINENPDLRLNLQERFNYIMIDEFQDTNRAQLRMARSLTRPLNPGDTPNILAVGDDDQAVFRFQGADIGNIDLFETEYGKPFEIVLAENYRSHQQILDQSRKISRQIADSLEQQRQLVKDLHSDVKKSGAGVVLNEFERDSQQNSWIAGRIKELCDAGEKGGQIAILGRERKQLDDLVPYLRSLEIPIEYERRENVLDQPHIRLLLDMARLVNYLGSRQLEPADELLARILSEPMWNIPPSDIWKISRRAYEQGEFWLDIILNGPAGAARRAAEFLVEVGAKSQSLPFEQVIDLLLGAGPAGAEDERDDPEPPATASFKSPFKSYFFGKQLLRSDTNQYLKLLSNLSTLRRHLRNYQDDERRVLTVTDLVNFTDSYIRAGLYMIDEAPHCEDSEAIKLMTVHKAKGLEFEHVFITGVVDSIWNKTGSSNTRLSYPANLAEIRPSRNEGDDALRLLFVAMTRAKQELFINYYKSDDSAKAQQPYGPLLALGLGTKRPDVAIDTASLAQEYEQRWLKYHGSLSKTEMSVCLKDTLAKYSLSATHLNNFTDVSAGGPVFFLTQNLLNFPSAKSPSAIYGSAIHAALRLAHESVKGSGKINIQKTIDYFRRELSAQPLARADSERLLARGQEALQAYLEKFTNHFHPSQVVEFDFRDQGVCVGQARLRGLIDLMDFNEQTRSITVSDYKTGASESKWQLPPSAPEHERIKLHKYRQQLLFYKILIDGSAEYGRRGWKADAGVLRFVEPDNYGRFRNLELDYDRAELDRFKRLIQVIWRHIQELDLPDTSSYPPSLEGIIKFEEDLLRKSTGS